jgi:succinate dehydrogenase hydrophobic anchor subunit
MTSAGWSGRLLWVAQLGLGLLLLLLLGVHLVVNHLAAPQGLLTYADIVRYYHVPGIAAMEGVLLVVVTAHCLLGVHSILLDLHPSAGLRRVAMWLLVFVGLAAVGYGLWLIGVVSGRPPK